MRSCLFVFCFLFAGRSGAWQCRHSHGMWLYPGAIRWRLGGSQSDHRGFHWVSEGYTKPCLFGHAYQGQALHTQQTVRNMMARRPRYRLLPQKEETFLPLLPAGLLGLPKHGSNQSTPSLQNVLQG
jgi:hypothetical protein